MAEQRKVIRLTKEARDHLDTAFNSGVKYPTSEQKIKLLKQINSFAGNEDYSKQALARWFSQRRANDGKQKSKGEQQMSRTHAILYPSLANDAILQLDELYTELVQKHKTRPPLKIIHVWARALNANPDHVANWIDERIALDNASSHDVPPLEPLQVASWSHAENLSFGDHYPETHSQLPTPLQSTSPEPRPDGMIKYEPLHSPRIDHTILQGSISSSNKKTHEGNPRRPTPGAYLSSPVSPSLPDDHIPTFVRQPTNTHTSPSNSVDRSRPPLSSTDDRHGGIQQQQDVIPPSTLQQKRELLAKALTSNDQQPPPVHNSAVFNELMQPYETKIRSFLDRVSKGELRHAGWDPNLVKQQSDKPAPISSKAHQ